MSARCLRRSANAAPARTTPIDSKGTVHSSNTPSGPSVWMSYATSSGDFIAKTSMKPMRAINTQIIERAVRRPRRVTTPSFSNAASRFAFCLVTASISVSSCVCVNSAVRKAGIAAASAAVRRRTFRTWP